MAKTVLIVDDDPTQRRIIRTVLEKNHLNTIEADSGESALQLFVEQKNIDVAIFDVIMGEMNGIETLKEIRKKGIDTPVIVQTSQGSIDTVITAMQSGAQDFIIKPASPERLMVSIQNALQIKLLKKEVRRLQKTSNNQLDFNSLIANSHMMKQIIMMGIRAAKSNIPILILGESGVGKEVFARAIQGESDRSGKPFITVNCGAIPANLVESILFGHEKGSFTGASSKHAGKFKEADGGTLFLDEIGELPLDIQVKLLRVLQEGEIDPVGASSPQKINVRIISATNQNLKELVKSGSFREDLYYRLNVFPITIPALRERSEDIHPLTQYFIDLFNLQEKKNIKGITDETLKILKEYNWPGNIRQLENTIFRAIILCEGNYLKPYDFPAISGQMPPLTSSSKTNQPDQQQTKHALLNTNPLSESEKQLPFNIHTEEGHLKTLEAIESEIIKYAITTYSGHMSEIARRLGIGRSTLYRKIREHNIEEKMEENKDQAIAS